MPLDRSDFLVYAVTDRFWSDDDDHFFQQIQDAALAGVRIFQLREKALPPDQLLDLARRFVRLCRNLNVFSIINDFPEIARDSEADGVHVGQADSDVSRARMILGPNKIIGVSTHSVREALDAQKNGADYLGVGAAFPSATKLNASAVSFDTIRAVAHAVRIPVVAIGGISAHNISQLKNCGLAGVAVVSAIFAQQDVSSAASDLFRLAHDFL